MKIRPLPPPVRKNFLAVGTGGKAVITSRKSMELLITDPEKLRNTLTKILPFPPVDAATEGRSTIL